jgi:hypothetical protein
LSDKAIRSALETILSTWAAGRVPALRVAWDNVPFTTATGETYLRAYMLPAATISTSFGGADHDYRGIFQVTVAAPVDSGSGVALGIAEEVIALYPNNLITATTPPVQIVKPPSIATAMVDGVSFVVPVSITYRAFT